MNTTNQPFDIRDELDTEVHNMRAAWWMKYGILSVFLILAIVLTLAAVIQYPDVVRGEFKFHSSQPAVTIPLLQGVQIEELFRHDGDMLKKGDPIMLFKNNACYQDMIYAEKLLTTNIVEADFNIVYDSLTYRNLNLGDIQDLWSQLYYRLFDYYTITKERKYDAKVERLTKQLREQCRLREKLKDLLAMNKHEKDIRQKNLAVDSSLHSNGVISKADYRSVMEVYIGKDKNAKNDEIILQRNEIEIANLVNAIKTTEEEKSEQIVAVRLQITEAINKLKAGIEGWKKNYLIEAPVDGQLNYLGNIDSKKYVNLEEHVVVVTPVSQDFKATVKIPAQRAGKIVPEQQVHLKLNDYPYREYGYLEGRLATISNVAGSDYYVGQVHLGVIMQTNNGKDIVVKENMGGMAEIITRKRSLLARVLDKFLYVFSQ